MANVVSRSCLCFDSDAGRPVQVFAGQTARRDGRSSASKAGRILCAGLMLAAAGLPCRAAPLQAASSPINAGAQQSNPNSTALHGQQEPDPMAHRIEEHMADRRNTERQKMLVEDTDKLLALAQQLKADVDKSDKNMLSIDVVKRAEQIEKLARSVKEKMRGN